MRVSNAYREELNAMEAVLEEMVRIAQTNPLPYLAIALVGVLLGLFARPSLPIALELRAPCSRTSGYRSICPTWCRARCV